LQGKGVVLIGADILFGLEVQDVKLEDWTDGGMLLDKAHFSS
jgi:hypothetical protein